MVLSEVDWVFIVVDIVSSIGVDRRGSDFPRRYRDLAHVDLARDVTHIVESSVRDLLRPG